MVIKNNHINIILVNIPYRYDTTNTNTVNEGIEKFNKNLEKLIKASPNASFLKTDQNRKLFTNMDFVITDCENNYCFIKKLQWCITYLKINPLVL